MEENMSSPEEQFPALAADAAANPDSSSAHLLKTIRSADAALEELKTERRDASKSQGKRE
jgi:hypothetical protein